INAMTSPPGPYAAPWQSAPQAPWPAGPRLSTAPAAPPVGWSVAKHPVTAAGLTIPGDMLYVGRGLAAGSGGLQEPALIDPWLPVDWQAPDWPGQTMGYWPSYSTISPQSRAAYLYWLSTGRRHPDVFIGYVFLFFYGLERRVLVDWPHAPQVQGAELPLIRAEVDQLLNLFGGNSSFARCAGRFREVLEAISLLGTDVCAEPVPVPNRESPPIRLRLGLGGFAAGRRPLPAGWAMAWLMSQPDFYPRTPMTRCGPEFAELFRARYAAQFGAGIVIPMTGTSDLTIDYRPASGGLARWPRLVFYGRPDVIGQTGPLRELVALADECAEALDAFSRFLGRSPEGRGSVAATALLPPELVDLTGGEVGTLISWARSHLTRSATVTVPASELQAHLPLGQSPTKKEAVTLARLLAAAGIGMEPDPRLGGPVPGSGSMVLFRSDETVSVTPSDVYQAATVLLHLGAAVSAADGQVSADEKELLVSHLEEALYLSAVERTRLRAHLMWLLTAELKLTGLTGRIDALDEVKREQIAEFLAAVAAADGVIDPAEVTLLKQIRKMLGLDPEGVHSSLHTAAAEPVTIREARASPGYAIPAEEGRVKLDRSVLAARLTEAAEVAALLGSVFAEPNEAPSPPVPPTAQPVAGLDGAHSALLRALAERDTISRAEWSELTSQSRLMPDGALDRLNEASYEVTGEPLAEGDDPIEINRYVMGELL
ncbi:MAG: hypothetical protein JWN00_4258, partial [Actinomycetia bacterium]|nr:hypothetical protein [Actinomycetes bacterium]